MSKLAEARDIEWEFDAPQWVDFNNDECAPEDSWFESRNSDGKLLHSFEPEGKSMVTVRRPSRLPIRRTSSSDRNDQKKFVQTGGKLEKSNSQVQINPNSRLPVHPQMLREKTSHLSAQVR